MQLLHHKGEPEASVLFTSHNHRIVLTFNIDPKKIQVPYATLIALIMCWAGVGVFCGTLYRGVNLTLRLLQDVFKLDRGLDW